jgi:hypothetical protein
VKTRIPRILFKMIDAVWSFLIRRSMRRWVKNGS